ncbi:hypothetical protein RRG08_040926 [Elysia crispata]|uniref:Uncharacterized protein n=1 Tax=Elysia crispata TaxID=231223 RepID=A0AAE0XQP3_9GAST|nr:hypothetical protein RRG08_040926 [Elysia crispata]
MALVLFDVTEWGSYEQVCFLIVELQVATPYLFIDSGKENFSLHVSTWLMLEKLSGLPCVKDHRSTWLMLEKLSGLPCVKDHRSHGRRDIRQACSTNCSMYQAPGPTDPTFPHS